MSCDIRNRLKSANKTQVWMIKELHKRGLTVLPGELSSVLTGVLMTPKAEKIIEMCNTILEETENADEGTGD